jgi:hypothetical protein
MLFSLMIEAQTGVSRVMASPKSLPVPADLDGEARQIWLDLVTAAKPEHFQPVDARRLTTGLLNSGRLFSDGPPESPVFN